MQIDEALRRVRKLPPNIRAAVGSHVWEIAKVLATRVEELEADNAKLKVHPIGIRKQRINDLEQRLIEAIGTADHQKLSAMSYEFHAEQAIDGLADDLHISASRVAELEGAKSRLRAALIAAEIRVAELKAAAGVKPIADAPRDGTEIVGLCRVTCTWSVKLRMWWTDMPSVMHPEYFEPDGQRGEGSR